jgi:3',5'-cyclic AMP phosphodiesterase CpdA
VRIVHLSDIHVWRIALNPLRWLSKRPVGTFELLTGRARRFRLERLSAVVDRVLSLSPDHVLITGDLTTTALSSEFQAAKLALAPLLSDPSRATVLPGNHDRYTTGSVLYRKFENAFGEFAPRLAYPWLKWLDTETTILGLDPTRSHLTARGFLPPTQLAEAERLISEANGSIKRLIVACHYPVLAPPEYQRELARKRLVNAERLLSWLPTIGPHLYCCGHVHAAWAFRPPAIPDELCLNSGAPLLRDPTGRHLPGFLEINLDGPDVEVIHHAWKATDWTSVPMMKTESFFAHQSMTR